MKTTKYPDLPHPPMTESPREIAENCEAIWFGAGHGKAWKLIEAYFQYRQEAAQAVPDIAHKEDEA